MPNWRIAGGYNKSRGSGDTCLCPDTQKQGDPSLAAAGLLPELKKKNLSVICVLSIVQKITGSLALAKSGLSPM